MRRWTSALKTMFWAAMSQTPLCAAEPPAKILDLSPWKLTLPVDTERPGHPDEIRQRELNSFQDPKHFFVNQTAQGVVLRAYCGGSTTKGSKYPRCELREMGARGDKLAAWATDDGSVHTMTMRVAIMKTPAVRKHVVCAQIHDADDDLLMVRLEGTTLLVERNSDKDVVLVANYSLGTPFDLKIQAGGGHVQVWRDGAVKLNWQTSRRGCYFKAGCYTLSNPERGDAPDSYGEIIMYRLQVEHVKTR